MKYILLLISLNISLSYAQKFKFGPELGGNLIKVETQEIGDNYQVGWHTGVFSEYEFKKWLGVSVGLYYTQKKHSFKESEVISSSLSFLLAQQNIEGVDLNTYSETKGRVTLNYLQLPLLAVFKHKNFKLKLGGYFGYMFNTKTNRKEVKNTPFASVIDLTTLTAIDPTLTELIGSFIPPANETNFSESTSKSGLSTFDYGLKTGITYHVNSIGFNVNYIYGLTDYRSSSSINSFENNCYYQFSLSYYFGKGSLKKPSYNSSNPSI